ncbi:MAG: hypothetical protein N2Z40_00190 [Caldimicrobium sp.]|nr:hypothetical protein [Caldimicrobium sp.]MCX7612632.1 hypothetical protein [Caldimicrobium sp.]MDW8182215.1 hypothetical protein [Caldimicrobium sp.]
MKKRLKIYKFLQWFRELQEEQARVRAHNASLNLQKLREEREIIEEEFKECQSHLQEKQIFTGDELKGWFSYFEVLSEFLEISDKKIEKQERALQELTDDLLKKHLEKRLIERLYQKSLNAYKEYNLKIELRTLDDLILLRKGRYLDQN